jgi:hypothetical protein
MVIYEIFVFGADRKSNMAARAHNVFWLVEILKMFLLETTKPIDSCYVCFKLTYWFQRRRLLNFFSIGSNVKTKSSHGGHLEFPISKRFTSLVQDHPMIIPEKSQFNPSKMATFSGHTGSFNIGPYGKKCFKIFSSETSKQVSLYRSPDIHKSS